jgi:hypothetical protein
MRILLTVHKYKDLFLKLQSRKQNIKIMFNFANTVIFKII